MHSFPGMMGGNPSRGGTFGLLAFLRLPLLFVRFVVTLGVAAAGLALGAAALAQPLGLMFSKGGHTQLVQIGELEQASERSYVYAADGSLITVLHAEENRSP